MPRKPKVELLPRSGKKRSVKAIVQDIRQRFYWAVMWISPEFSGVGRISFTHPGLFRTKEEAEHMCRLHPGDNGMYWVVQVEMGSFTKSQMRRGKECKTK